MADGKVEQADDEKEEEEGEEEDGDNGLHTLNLIKDV